MLTILGHIAMFVAANADWLRMTAIRSKAAAQMINCGQAATDPL